MKQLMKPVVALSVLLTTLNAIVPCHAAERTTSAPAPVRQTAPVVVARQTPLSNAQRARYAQQAAQSRTANQHLAAGASSKAAWWVLGGVAVVAGVVALSSGGGYGGGGSGGMGGGGY